MTRVLVFSVELLLDLALACGQVHVSRETVADSNRQRDTVLEVVASFELLLASRRSFCCFT